MLCAGAGLGSRFQAVPFQSRDQAHRSAGKETCAADRPGVTRRDGGHAIEAAANGEVGRCAHRRTHDRGRAGGAERALGTGPLSSASCFPIAGVVLGVAATAEVVLAKAADRSHPPRGSPTGLRSGICVADEVLCWASCQASERRQRLCGTQK